MLRLQLSPVNTVIQKCASRWDNVTSKLLELEKMYRGCAVPMFNERVSRKFFGPLYGIAIMVFDSSAVLNLWADSKLRLSCLKEFKENLGSSRVSFDGIDPNWCRLVNDTSLLYPFISLLSVQM